MICYDLTSRSANPIPLPKKPTIAVLGNFDGVHIGHQSLLRHAAALCETYPEAQRAIWTFDPHPILLTDPHARFLSNIEDRLAIFASFGIEIAILEQYASVHTFSPERFVREILRDVLHCCAVVCGCNFHFGQGGCGDASLLAALTAQEGIACKIGPLVEADGIPVSSTRIRNMLLRGETEDAARLLGRPYTLSGKVVYGRQIGRTIGFPTINQTLPPHLLVPADGVYATVVTLEDGRMFRGVTNIGNQPTFDSTQSCMETHLIGFEGNLYGSTVRLSFWKKLRDIRRFPSSEALHNAIRADIDAANRLNPPHIS